MPLTDKSMPNNRHEPVDQLHHRTETDVSHIAAARRFMVTAQGRVYAMRPGERSPTQKLGRPRGAVVFVGQARALFDRHPGCDVWGFKRLFGEFRTTEPGDMVWNDCDAVLVGDVLLVTRARIVPIAEPVRSASVKFRLLLGSWRGGIAYAAAVVVGTLILLVAGVPDRAIVQGACVLVALTIACSLLSWLLPLPDIQQDVDAALSEARSRGLIPA